MALSLRELQDKLEPWQKHNFPESTAEDQILGVVEEVGELSHHFLKRKQGIRSHENHDEEIRDACADIVIYLANFCNMEGIDLSFELLKAWSAVKDRDWQKDPETAHLANVPSKKYPPE